MADLKKLTKLDNSLKMMKPQFKIIIDNLDKIFAVSENSMVNISKYFNQFNIEETIFEDDNGERIVSLIKAGLKKYEKTQTDKCACLPIHINDYEWLADYTIEMIKRIIPNFNYSRTVVKNFLKKSPEFENARRNYQNCLVREMILNTTIDNPFVKNDSNYRSHSFFPYDEIFRNKIISQMKILNAKRKDVEVVIEKHADLWRKQNMIRAFDEFYYPQSDKPSLYDDYLEWCRIYKKHCAAWLKYREFEYFAKHKNAVTIADTMTDGMMLSQFGFFNAVQETTEYNEQRLNLLQNIKIKSDTKVKDI